MPRLRDVAVHSLVREMGAELVVVGPAADSADAGSQLVENDLVGTLGIGGDAAERSRGSAGCSSSSSSP